MRIQGLPMADQIAMGLEEARQQQVTEASLLVSIAASALRRLGLDVVPLEGLSVGPNRSLYQLLCGNGTADPYRRYNALIRGLISFTQALEGRQSRERGL